MVVQRRPRGATFDVDPYYVSVRRDLKPSTRGDLETGSRGPLIKNLDV